MKVKQSGKQASQSRNQLIQQNQQSHQKNTAKSQLILKSFISGGIAGMCSKSLIAPIQRVKYLFITRSRKFSYKAYMDDLRSVVKKNGVKDLWRGNLLNIGRVFPNAAIDFSVFDYMRSRFYRKQQKFSKIVLFLCGASAGICSLSLTTPIDFLRVRRTMQRENFSYNSNSHAMKMILQRQGFLGFYKGYGASVTGIFLYHGSSFFIFAKLKENMKVYYPSSYKKWYVDFLLGGVSALGQLMAYPFDVLRKRMQGQHLLFEREQISQKQNYRQLIRSIIVNEGFWKGMYKGISLNLIKAPIASATAWTVKNFINRLLDPNYDL